MVHQDQRSCQGPLAGLKYTGKQVNSGLSVLGDKNVLWENEYEIGFFLLFVCMCCFIPLMPTELGLGQAAATNQEPQSLHHHLLPRAH